MLSDPPINGDEYIKQKYRQRKKNLYIIDLYDKYTVVVSLAEFKLIDIFCASIGRLYTPGNTWCIAW